ncbi:hypothetical protein IG631_14826 [Alternaria alternata]|nr:hypothetical protein IG631_14826 [Alternaria alternata]
MKHKKATILLLSNRLGESREDIEQGAVKEPDYASPTKKYLGTTKWVGWKQREREGAMAGK